MVDWAWVSINGVVLTLSVVSGLDLVLIWKELKMEQSMTNQAPYPNELQSLVTSLSYRPGWTISLEKMDRGQGSVGLTLLIQTEGYNSYRPQLGLTYRVNHYFIVPAASYNRKSWQRWLLDQILLVEQHEACEFFVVDHKRPYAPHHGDGENPYTIFDHGTTEQTTFRPGTRDDAS